MNAEIAVYQEWIRSRLAMAVDCLDGLNEAQLNWRPPVDGGNSIYVLAAHSIGCARAWVLGIVCGQPVGRDRPGEFAATGAAEALRRDLASLDREIADALAALDVARLDHRYVPAQELWGENETREISVREALMKAAGHVTLHLGHLQLTRDLALRLTSDD